MKVDIFRLCLYLMKWKNKDISKIVILNIFLRIVRCVHLFLAIPSAVYVMFRVIKQYCAKAPSHIVIIQGLVKYLSSQELTHYTPRFNEVERGVYWFHLVRLPVCPSVDRIVSAPCLQQYSLDPFHICTSYQATSEGVSRVMFVSKLKKLKFWRILWICNFDFVFFWLGIQYDSEERVIMRRQGVSSERRRSIPSS